MHECKLECSYVHYFCCLACIYLLLVLELFVPKPFSKDSRLSKNLPLKPVKIHRHTPTIGVDVSLHLPLSMSNDDGKFYGRRVVSRESSSVDDVIDLLDDDDDGGGGSRPSKRPVHELSEQEQLDAAIRASMHNASGEQQNAKSLGNNRHFRGGRQSQLLSLEPSDVIDLIHDGGDEATKRRRKAAIIPTSSKKRRSSYDEPTKAKDHAAITHEIVAMLGQLRNVDTTLTCSGRVGCCASPSFSPRNQQPRYNHQPLHYQQNDNYSCGYRNLQMMISSMLPAVRSVFPDGVPSVHEIQTTTEQLWKQGVDEESAKFHNYTLVGKTGKGAHIGTIEAWAYLTYLGVDAAVVQFLDKNRAMVGDFIWNYFAKMAVGPDGCSCFDDVTIVQPEAPPIVVPSLSSFEYGCRLFNTRPVNGGDSTLRSSCTCALPSLYLQWEGHSITVAGIRKIKSTDGSPPSFNLIVLDPHQRGALTKAHLEKGIDSMSTLESVLTGMKSKKIKFELSVNELVTKRDNIQLMLSTAAILDASERGKRRKCRSGVHCITASTTYPLSREYAQATELSSLYN